MNEWHDIQISVPTGSLDEASAIAHMGGSYGIQVEDYSDLSDYLAPSSYDEDVVDRKLLAKDTSRAIIHVYIPANENPAETVSFLAGLYDSAGIDRTIAVASIEEKDWADEWKKYFHPVKVGKRLVVCPSWEAYEQAPEEVVLRIDPGMAFGTGTHHTSALCMRLLEEYVTEGCKVLDIGSGSGILSVAAALLGAGQVLGRDIDAMAVRIAEENAAVNNVAHLARFEKADLAAGLTGQYDIICANIVADVILRLTPEIGALLAPGGTYIVSGVIDSRADDVTACLAEYGFIVKRALNEGGWSAYAVGRA